MNETVVFRATAAGLGAIGVVVVAGETAFSVASELFRPKSSTAPLKTENRAFYGHIIDSGEVIDEALWLYHKRHPRWGCEVVELHIHGGSAVVERLMLSFRRKGIRRVSYSSFLKDAVESMCMSYLQMEAEEAASDCRSVAGVRVVASALSGALRREVDGIISLLDRGCLSKAEIRLRRLLSSGDAGVAAVSPRSFFIFGEPNVGKSTLFNRLVGAERTLVSDEAGTTVDVIEGSFTVRDYIIRVYDAAGIAGEETKSEKFALRFAEEADFLLLLVDGSMPRRRPRLTGSLKHKRRILVVSKSDLLDNKVVEGGGLPVSALIGNGVAELKEEMLRMATGGSEVTLPALFTKRQILCVREAFDALKCSSVIGAKEALIKLLGGKKTEK